MNFTAPEIKNIYSIHCFEKSVLAASSGRQYDSSHRQNFLKELRIDPACLALVKQVHGSEIAILRTGEKHDSSISADGLLTNEPNLALGILTADCIPAFFWDPERRAVGIIHAGWRGIRQEILAKAVHLMQKQFASDPKSIQIAFGPMIRKCCYEVGKEFREYFPQFFLPDPSREDKGLMDLTGAAADQLVREGVLLQNIFDSGICTVCRNSDFFSARKEKTSERILSVIQIQIA